LHKTERHARPDALLHEPPPLRRRQLPPVRPLQEMGGRTSPLLHPSRRQLPPHLVPHQQPERRGDPHLRPPQSLDQDRRTRPTGSDGGAQTDSGTDGGRGENRGTDAEMHPELRPDGQPGEVQLRSGVEDLALGHREDRRDEVAQHQRQRT
jgi:hypothetical protein